MGSRALRIGAAVCGLLLGAAFAQRVNAGDDDERERVVDFVVRYDVRAREGTDSVTLRTLVPQDVDARQRVLSLGFDPAPEKVYIEADERYARFVLKFDGETRRRRVEVRARLRLERFSLAVAREKGPVLRPPLKERARYLRAETYLETGAPSIRELADRLEGGGDAATAQQVWDLVVGTMQVGPYNSEDIGAVAALRAGTGDCTDYADLFITLCRAKGVPARMVEGYTIPWSNVPQHNWAEVYLQDYGWVPFDPFRGESGGARADRLRNVYVYLSRQRVDRHLDGYHFYAYRYPRGKGVDVETTIVVE